MTVPAGLRSRRAAPGAPAQLESEALLKLFFAERDGIQVMRDSVETMREDARAALGQLGSMAAQWEAGQVPFPKRGPTNAIPMRLVTDLHRTIAEGTDWADAALDRIAAGEEPARQLADEVYVDVAKDAIPVS